MAGEIEQQPGKKKKRPLLGKKVRNWIAAIISILVLIVVFQNTSSVEVRVLFWRWPMPQVVLMLLIFLCGTLLGYVIRRKEK